jgi:NADH dehydrogenase
MILIIGSTGKLGTEICRLLKEKNIPARAMIRTTTPEEKRNELRNLGFQLVEGDIRDKTTFSDALQGISTVITTVSSMPFSYITGDNDISTVDEKGIIKLIYAARESGVKHFVYVSCSGNMDLDFPLMMAKRKVENYLRLSGMTFSILRPGFFMELWLSPMVGFDPLNRKVNICGTGLNPVAYISLKDVARYAVECLDNPYVVNAIIELGGPENLAPLETVKLFEEVLGDKIDIQNIPVNILNEQFANATEPMQKSFAGLMCCMAKGDIIDMDIIRKKFKVKPLTVKEYIQNSMHIHLSTEI